MKAPVKKALTPDSLVRERFRMPNPWDLPKDIHDRLSNTYVRYNSRVVYVETFNTEDDETKLILYDPLGKLEQITVKPDDPGLDVSGFELGYMNLTSVPQVYYFSRPPSKQWKQGFMPQRARATSIDGSKGLPVPNVKNYYESLSGDYPDLDDAMKSDKTEVALSSQVAIQKTLSGVALIYINCKNVAHVTPGANKKIHIKDGNFRWAYARILQPLFGDQYAFNT